MLTFEPGGEVTLFNGSYTDYYESHRGLFDEIKGKSAAGTNENGKNNGETIVDGSGGNDGELPLSGAEAYKAQKSRNKKLKFTFQEQKEYETIEDDIAELEDRITELTTAFSDPKISADFVKLNELSKEKEKAEAALEQKMERYIYLEELAEAIKNQ